MKKKNEMQKFENKNIHSSESEKEAKQKGRSMIEMLGVLAIIGVLSGAGLYGYQKAMAKHRFNATINQMATIINNVRTAFASSNTGSKPYAIFGKSKSSSKEGMDLAKALNIFPAEMLVAYASTGSGSGGSGSGGFSGTGVQNLYRGDVYIITEDDGESFEVIFEKLPPEVSSALGTVNWGVEDPSGLQEVLIYGNKK